VDRASCRCCNDASVLCSIGLDAGVGGGGGGGGGGDGGGDADLGWVRVFPHVLTASMANFLFGYHIGSVSLSLSTLQSSTMQRPDSSFRV
jgi:hypothetical protein